MKLNLTATFFDADGDGAGSGTNDIINLNAGTAYSLTITLTNTLGEMEEDVTAEIRKEDNDHQFFFGFTSGIFSSPKGGETNVDTSFKININ